MPELLEVEYYRRLAEHALGRPVAEVVVPDPHCLGGSTTVASLTEALVDTAFTAARRRGKLLLLDLDRDGRTLGVRFGMTGGLVVDDRLAIDRLLYGPGTFSDVWVRLSLRLADGGTLALHDPRRFGRVLLDPDEEALGPDALTVTPAVLRRALAARPPGPALKARLLDQSRLAGVGNLLADEMLWRASLSPERPCTSLGAAEHRRLHHHLRATLVDLLERGGSHTGDLMAERRPGGVCRRDGTPLRHGTVGGRSTWWCPHHQT